MKPLLLFLALALWSRAQTSPYTFTETGLAVGNSSASGGPYSIDAALGETGTAAPSADGAGPYDLFTGFWDPFEESVPPAAASLSITLADGQIHLAWTAQTPGWILEQADGPEASANWTAVTPAPVGAVHVLPAEGARFFRLRRP